MTHYNMKSYKLAKVFATDLNIIIVEVEEQIKKLAPYVRYSPVGRILHVLKDELATLKAHQTNCNKIVAAKGQVRPEGLTDE